MRVEDSVRRADERSKSSFQEALKKAKLPRAPVAPASPAMAPKLAKPVASAPTEKPKVPARSEPGAKPSAKVGKLIVERRSEAEVHRPEIKRVAEKIAAMLIHAPIAEAPEKRAEVPATTSTTTPNAPRDEVPGAPAPAQGEILAGQIERLIEHAELLARAQGPALHLGLNQGMASNIEVVRTGKGEVALRLEARSTSERRALAGQTGKLRAALAERGLRVREVVIG